MPGIQSEKISLQITDNYYVNLLIQLLLSFGLGIIAYSFHGLLKNSIGIPGHQGLIYMAILITAKLTSGSRVSGTLAAMGTGTIILLGPAGFSEPLRIAAYMLPGLLLDPLFLFHQRKGLIRSLISVSLIGGLAYMAIPALKIFLVAIAGIPYPAIAKYGMPMTLFSFFFFGLTGSIAGFLAHQGFSRRKIIL
jgi:hypothetical protein